MTPINRGKRTGLTIVGVEPAIHWKFGNNRVAAAGVLFTATRQTAIDIIYSNISFDWY